MLKTQNENTIQKPSVKETWKKNMKTWKAKHYLKTHENLQNKTHYFFLNFNFKSDLKTHTSKKYWRHEIIKTRYSSDHVYI